MHTESIVYGYIKTAGDLSNEARFQASLANRKALMALPTHDACAFLTRDMFSAPSLVTKEESASLIHFGHAYNGVEYEWGLWMSHFEALLKQMYWDSVVVQLETEISGTHTFSWNSGDTDHIPGNTPLNMRCEWQHELGLCRHRA